MKITENGEVYRLKKGQMALSKGYHCNGYLYTSICENKRQKHIGIHRLVAEAFIPNPDNFPQINHKDGNKQNNHIENLEWCTAEQNMRHAAQIGLIKSRQGHGKKCPVCNIISLMKNGECGNCKTKEKAVKWRKYNAELKEKRLKDEFSCVDSNLLNETEKMVVEKRLKGESLKKIGLSLGVSQEIVSRYISKIKRKNIVNQRRNNATQGQDIENNISPIEIRRNRYSKTQNAKIPKIRKTTPTLHKISNN